MYTVSPNQISHQIKKRDQFGLGWLGWLGLTVNTCLERDKILHLGTKSGFWL